MSCKNCNGVSKVSCDETLCNGSVSLPCDIMLPAECIKNVTALPNLGECTEQSNDYACTDLQTVLLAIDGLLENCGVDTHLESASLEGTTLTLTLTDETDVTVNLSSLNYWARSSGSGYLYPATLTDKVGIGTNTPTHKLHVTGDFKSLQVPSANQESFVVNGEQTINFPTSGPATINGSILGYETSSFAGIISVLNNTVTLFSDDATAQSQLDLNSLLGANLQCTVSTDNYSFVRASKDNEVWLGSQTASDNTSFKITPTQLTIDGNVGWSGSFTNGDGDTVTVVKGIITNVAP